MGTCLLPEYCASVQYMTDPVSPPIARLIELFSEQFQDLSFPEVDGPVLEGSAAVAREAALRVQEAEAALEAARARLGEAQGDLAHKAHRALAYLRVHLEEDEERSALLDSIVLPRPAKRMLRRRPEELSEPNQGRRRSKAKEVEVPGLFEAGAAVPNAEVDGGEPLPVASPGGDSASSDLACAAAATVSEEVVGAAGERSWSRAS
jgi:hypothetical protein